MTSRYKVLLKTSVTKVGSAKFCDMLGPLKRFEYIVTWLSERVHNPEPS
jgi:hypothetical protein